VGNITIGGSGKTPTVEYLSKLFQSKGIKVGIISRGYKRKSKQTLIVTDGITKPQSWEDFGDEPYLLAQNLENIPIVVGRSRYEAGMKMIENFDPDIIIMDDGFQHVSLYRDLDIVLVNSKDTKATHRLIPAGKLREPLSNLSRADLIILSKSNVHKPSDYLIDIIEKGEVSISTIKPNMICIPFIGSTNQDHVAVAKASFTACRPVKDSRKNIAQIVLSYEQPETNWTRKRFHPNFFIDITKNLKTKQKALSLYSSQIRSKNHPRTPSIIEKIAELRGSEIGVKYAEAYECHRFIV